MSLDEHARAGLKALEDRDLEAAIQHLSEAVRLAPDRPDITNLLGMAYLHRGEVGSAIPHLERSIQLAEGYDAPEHQEVRQRFHAGMATAYQLADRVADAAATLEVSLARWPDVETRVQLAQLHLMSCGLDRGVELLREIAEDTSLELEDRKASEAVVGAIELFRTEEESAGMFLQAHRDSYVEYFDQVVAEQTREGWLAEAQRMTRGADGELKPVLAQGARPWAFSRVDIVNPATAEVYNVYSDQEPMIVGVEGLEPLAQLPVLLPWTGYPFEVWVSSQAPWHWLGVAVQFSLASVSEAALVARIDDVVGGWYLEGFNGTWGASDRGRFHDVSDAMVIGDRAVSWYFDLGRARFEAIHALLNRLVVLHDSAPLDRVVFGRGRLPE